MSGIASSRKIVHRRIDVADAGHSSTSSAHRHGRRGHACTHRETAAAVAVFVLVTLMMHNATSGLQVSSSITPATPSALENISRLNSRSDNSTPGLSPPLRGGQQQQQRGNPASRLPFLAAREDAYWSSCGKLLATAFALQLDPLPIRAFLDDVRLLQLEAARLTSLEEQYVAAERGAAGGAEYFAAMLADAAGVDPDDGQSLDRVRRIMLELTAGAPNPQKHVAKTRSATEDDVQELLTEEDVAILNAPLRTGIDLWRHLDAKISVGTVLTALEAFPPSELVIVGALCEPLKHVLETVTDCGARPWAPSLLVRNVSGAYRGVPALVVRNLGHEIGRSRPYEFNNPARAFVEKQWARVAALLAKLPKSRGSERAPPDSELQRRLFESATLGSSWLAPQHYALDIFIITFGAGDVTPALVWTKFAEAAPQVARFIAIYIGKAPSQSDVEDERQWGTEEGALRHQRPQFGSVDVLAEEVPAGDSEPPLASEFEASTGRRLTPAEFVRLNLKIRRNATLHSAYRRVTSELQLRMMTYWSVKWDNTEYGGALVLERLAVSQDQIRVLNEQHIAAIKRERKLVDEIKMKRESMIAEAALKKEAVDEKSLPKEWIAPSLPPTWTLAPYPLLSPQNPVVDVDRRLWRATQLTRLSATLRELSEAARRDIGPTTTHNRGALCSLDAELWRMLRSVNEKTASEPGSAPIRSTAATPLTGYRLCEESLRAATTCWDTCATMICGSAAEAALINRDPGDSRASPWHGVWQRIAALPAFASATRDRGFLPMLGVELPAAEATLSPLRFPPHTVRHTFSLLPHLMRRYLASKNTQRVAVLGCHPLWLALTLQLSTALARPTVRVLQLPAALSFAHRTAMACHQGKEITQPKFTDRQMLGDLFSAESVTEDGCVSMLTALKSLSRAVFDREVDELLANSHFSCGKISLHSGSDPGGSPRDARKDAQRRRGGDYLDETHADVVIVHADVYLAAREALDAGGADAAAAALLLAYNFSSSTTIIVVGTEFVCLESSGWERDFASSASEDLLARRRIAGNAQSWDRCATPRAVSIAAPAGYVLVDRLRYGMGVEVWTRKKR